MRIKTLCAGLLTCAIAAALLPAPATAGVIASLTLEDRTPTHVSGDRFTAGHLEREWSVTFGTFSSADNRVGYNDFVVHDNAESGRRQVYTIGFEDRADEDVWAEYSATLPGPYTITLNGPAGFSGELHTTAYGANPVEGDVQNASHHPYVGTRSAEMANSGAGEALDQKYWLHFTSSTHDVLGISIVGCNSWIKPPANGDDWGATLAYYRGGTGGTLLYSSNAGVFFPNGYYDDNFMGYVDTGGMDTLLIDLSTGTSHDGEIRFDELAIIVQEKTSVLIPEPGAGALLLAGLLGALRRRR